MTVINKAAVKVKKSNGPPDMWPETHAEMARRAAQKAPKLELFSAFKLTDVSKAHTLLGMVRTSTRLMCQPGVCRTLRPASTSRTTRSCTPRSHARWVGG